jgi:hypothetical protein
MVLYAESLFRVSSGLRQSRDRWVVLSPFLMTQSVIMIADMSVCGIGDT